MNALHTAPATETEIVTTEGGEGYEITWHLTECKSRKAAHAALRAEGYRYMPPVRRAGSVFAGTGLWYRAGRMAVVEGSTIKAR